MANVRDLNVISVKWDEMDRYVTVKERYYTTEKGLSVRTVKIPVVQIATLVMQMSEYYEEILEEFGEAEDFMEDEGDEEEEE